MIQATNLPDAWWQLLSLCLSDGYRQDIEQGSCEGDTVYRLQLPPVAACINYPSISDMVPDFKPGVAPQTDRDTIWRYFEQYIIGTKPPADNEAYTYAERMRYQLPRVMDMPNGTNQATIEIGSAGDVELSDPACLRCIDLKVIDGRLYMTVFWRSNDLWSAWLTNHGGLTLLLHHVAEYRGLPVGTLTYMSAGSHIYSDRIDQVRLYLGR